jgi:hypothetical protein
VNDAEERARLDEKGFRAMIGSLDHLVLSVRDPDATARFYVEGLGMTLREFDAGAQGAPLRRPEDQPARRGPRV